jgi:murein DD-endopeptidase MepM/ murein hydrolase activator NlpD
MRHSITAAAVALAIAAAPAGASAATTGGVTAPSVSGGTTTTSVTGGTRVTSTPAPPPARKHRKRKRRRKPPPAPAPVVAPTATHVFPLTAAFTYGDGFGVDRPGHMHQGQDLLAPQGTPIVAPHGGTVTKVAYQAGGAGNYVVLSGSGETLDYVFMHMVTGSVRVSEGQTVKIGQRIGDVGSTGASSGPHLHFEIWQGPWAAGGTAIDPLPYLKRWAR